MAQTNNGETGNPVDHLSAVSVSGGTVAQLASVCRHCNGDGEVYVEGRHYHRDPGDVRVETCGFCDGTGIGAEVA